MAGFTAGFVLVIEPAVAVTNPGAVVHIVKSMRAIRCQLQAPPHVTNRTVADLPGEALERLGCHIVVRSVISNWPLGMSAAVASFAPNPPMPLAETIQGIVLLGEALVGCKQW